MNVGLIPVQERAVVEALPFAGGLGGSRNTASVLAAAMLWPGREFAICFVAS